MKAPPKPSSTERDAGPDRRIATVMSRDIQTVPWSATAEEATRLANERKVHHLLVIDAESAVGIVCLCDTGRARPTDPLARIMKTPFVFVCPDWSLARVAELVQRIRVGFLPVVDQSGQVLGVVTRSDLRTAGELPSEERGVDLCASCGTSHGLTCSSYTGGIAFCRDCLEQTKAPVDSPYVTLGGEG